MARAGAAGRAGGRAGGRGGPGAARWGGARGARGAAGAGCGPPPCWGTMSSNDFKNGSTIEMDGVPYRVQGEGGGVLPAVPARGPCGAARGSAT